MLGLLFFLIPTAYFSLVFAVGGYIVDKTTPEDEEVLAYEKQIQERKRANHQSKRHVA